MLTCFVLLALFASVQGRAVNISNTWVLPEEGFPVFYRYFRDRISWYEADAVCQFHHANLVTVDTTAQYDAVRAYLKELDISSAVWVGLIRSNPDGDFTWTDYRGLSGDGYWSSAPDARAAPLCAAADPAADYRWEARACGGPTVASFICELPVPQWALGNEGCMVRELPALTILYLPESAAVQLTADCGLAGVKRVQCTGNVKRENLLKDISCNDEVELLSTSSPMQGGSTWSLSDYVVNSTDLETTDVTTEEDITTEHDIKATQITSTSTPVQEKAPVKPIVNKLNKIYLQKNINLDLIHNNNLQSNDIPKLANTENFLTVEQTEKLEDEKHMHHKMLHDELAKHGNFETIFTQPTDHFVPPLVMAKSKISDDMTVLSLAEKHAQQLAEQAFSKHNLLDEKKEHISYDNNKSSPKLQTPESSKIEIDDKPLVITLQPIFTKDTAKKDKIKSLPKKYNEKYEDPKSRILKLDGKLLKLDKTPEKAMTINGATNTITEATKSNTELEDSMELTVHLKELVNNENTVKPKPTNDIFNIQNDESTNQRVTIQSIVTESTLNITSNLNDDEITKQTSTEHDKRVPISTTNADSQLSTLTTENMTTEASTQTDLTSDISMNHEVIKITIINEHDHTNHTVFEITTLVPKFKDAVNNDNKLELSTVSQQYLGTGKIFSSTDVVNNVMSSTGTETAGKATTTTVETIINAKSETNPLNGKEAATSQATTVSERITDTTTASLNNNQTQEIVINVSTTSLPYTTIKDKIEYNLTEIYEDEGRNATSPEDIDDFNSPLLSAANEPLHRPNRSRRPQTPPRLTKFNPFRILG